MKRIVTLAALAAFSFPAHAYVQTLQAGAVICLSKPAAERARDAIERGANAPGCFVTARDAQMERLSCSWSTCEARVWADGNEGAVVHVVRATIRR